MPPPRPRTAEVVADRKRGDSGREPGAPSPVRSTFTALRGHAVTQRELAAFSGRTRHRTEQENRAMLLQTFLTAKAATGIAAAGLVVIGGGTAAAYTGSLPLPLQNLAHDTIGAPAAQPESDATDQPDAATGQTPATAASPSPSGPDATGPAAFGLCTAYAHGGLATTSVAYQSLLAAATNATQDIPTYCATITHPGRPTGAPSRPATGKPADRPTPNARPSQANTDHPTGKPASLPAGPPSS